MNLKTVFIAIEGFSLQQGYIIKELSIVHLDNTYHHYLFKTPEDFTASVADMKIVNYNKKYLNGFSTEDDFYLPNHLHKAILEEFLNFKIYVVGSGTKAFISNILPSNVVLDVTSLVDFRYPEELPDPQCFKAHNHRYCALAKVKFLKNFMEKFFFREHKSFIEQ